MNEVQRLLAIGFPMEDALTVCHSMAREGRLEEFVARQEAEYAAAVIREAEEDGLFEL